MVIKEMAVDERTAAPHLAGGELCDCNWHATDGHGGEGGLEGGQVEAGHVAVPACRGVSQEVASQVREASNDIM